LSGRATESFITREFNAYTDDWKNEKPFATPFDY